MAHRSLRILLLMLIATCAPLVLAQTDEHIPDSELEATHEFHRNVITGFVGVTHEGSESGFALGIAYERLLSESFGVGVIAEHTFGDLDSWVYAVPFAYRSGPWRLYIAPGIVDGEHNTESLIRLGAEYAFEVGELEVAPHLAVDFVGGEEAIVFGFVVGKRF